MKNPNHHFWVITSYYNPIGYRRRLFNYRLFRQHLTLPLLTVEWSPAGHFELNDRDADVLLQIGSGDVLWQKERLLNLALQHLPRQCRYVAWIDCDVIFDDANWPSAAMHRLDSAHVMQLFSEALHVPSIPLDTSPSIEALRLMAPIHREFCWVSTQVANEALTNLPQKAGALSYMRRSGRLSTEPQYSPGIAWAARREVLDVAGLYDSNVLGGGDAAIALASVGQANLLPDKRALSVAHLRHYLEWAETFGRVVAGRVAYLPGKVYHLWHGEFSNRQYKNRHRLLHEANFDPLRDLRLSAEKVWEWSDSAAPLREVACAYFSDRREDG